MSARRPPSEPPAIPGFSYLELLGSGGFADVFLYEQRMPRRRVAIKVLLREALTEGARESFDAEANLMAQLSTHPSIVTIYQADISEDGRPYLAMEYCPKPNLGARYRREKIGVAEALRIGIQVAGAVETSHRAGILHRDIKPANILVTEYNRPALTDFGISVALVGGAGSEQESVGMSIPWSPPEVFGATPASGAAADIYSLGATVYTILAGRSPFEVPGGANGGLELIGRIQTAPLGRTGRADVPDSLEQVLATAMAKRESDRYASALEFARAMQKVQLELSLSVTPADVIDEQMAGDDFEEEDEGHTRIRGIVTIDPTAPPPTGSRRPAAPAAGTPPTGAPPTSPNGWRSSPFQDVDGATVRPDARTPSTSPGGGSDAGATGGGTAGGTGGVGTAANGWSSSGTREVDGAEAPSGGGTPSTPWGQQGARPGGASDDASTDGVRMRGDRDGAPATGRGAGGVEARDAFPVEETVHRAAVAPEQTATEAPRRRALPYLIGAAVVVLLAGTGALVFALNGGGSPAEQSAVETDRPVDQVDVGNASVPAPIDLVGTANADGTAIAFSWKNPDPREGDTFRWATVANGSTGQEQRIDEATVTVPTEGAAEVCIQVSLVRTDGKGSDPIAGCAP